MTPSATQRSWIDLIPTFVYQNQEAVWMRLHEKGGKHHEMPCQHNLKEWLREHIEAAGIGEDKDEPLFRTVDRKTRKLGSNRLDRQRAWRW